MTAERWPKPTLAPPSPGEQKLGEGIDKAPVVPPPLAGTGAAAPGDDGPSFGGGIGELPADCPVTPLGRAGMTSFYLDELRQLVSLDPQQHGRTQILALFGNRTDLLYQYAPAYDKEGKRLPNRFKAEIVGEQMLRSTAKAGVWNPLEKVRGAGAWPGEDGELILHCGNSVLFGHDWRPCGLIGRHVYPASDPLPRPSETAAPGGPKGAGQELLDLFRTWHWRRPDTDPMLLLGQVAAGMIGGALKWRPHAWLTGDSSTGKSTLQDIVKEVYGAGALLHSADASQAGITQLSGYGTLPVALDELEPDGDPRRIAPIVRLIRPASSGGQMLRGGSDHVGRQFTLRMCLWFSSILVPPLARQDRNRLAILELLPLGTEAKPPVVQPKRLRTAGEQLRRRLVDGWPRFAETLHVYRGVLAEGGHSGRGADQYGTLLALADLVLYDDVPEHAAAEVWAERLAAAVIAEDGDDRPDHERCLHHLLTALIDPWRNGTQKTIAQWAVDARTELSGGEGTEAGNALELYGTKVMQDGLERRWWLYVANQHNGLRKLFHDTHWQTPPDATGVWMQALRRVDGAEPTPSSVRFGGVPARATRLPLDLILPN